MLKRGDKVIWKHNINSQIGIVTARLTSGSFRGGTITSKDPAVVIRWSSGNHYTDREYFFKKIN